MRAMLAAKERTPARRQRPTSLRSYSAKSPAAARLEMRHDTRPITENNSTALRNSGVRQTLDSPGQPLGESLRPAMESQFAFDFSKVRIHNDARAAESASALNASAYTSGTHVVFGQGQFNPSLASGRALLAHELAHVAQQGAQGGTNQGFHALDSASPGPHEMEADRAADSVTRYQNVSPVTQATPGTLQRKIAMRDVGKGEQSGFARVPELITRLNGASTGLTFALTGSDLTYTVKSGRTLSNFDTQLQGFIDQAAVLPLRFTNRHGLLGNKAQGFHDSVTEDAWSSGYVDIDDLLASSDLGMQSVLVHFLRERTATSNYAKRLGSESLNTDPASPQGAAHQAEFDRAHGQGIQAELAVLRDFFSDPTIRLVDHDNDSQIVRIYRNGRKDTIRTRVRPGRGVNAGVDPVTIEVVTRDGKVHTPEEYKALLATAAAAPPPPVAISHSPNPPP
jgi:hypothetical protein